MYWHEVLQYFLQTRAINLRHLHIIILTVRGEDVYISVSIIHVRKELYNNIIFTLYIVYIGNITGWSLISVTCLNAHVKSILLLNARHTCTAANLLRMANGLFGPFGRTFLNIFRSSLVPNRICIMCGFIAHVLCPPVKTSEDCIRLILYRNTDIGVRVSIKSFYTSCKYIFQVRWYHLRRGWMRRVVSSGGFLGASPIPQPITFPSNQHITRNISVQPLLI